MLENPSSADYGEVEDVEDPEKSEEETCMPPLVERFSSQQQSRILQLRIHNGYHGRSAPVRTGLGCY